jgi:outer membrane protein OmpA-like peptidoglycan-associated protein
MFVRRGGLTCVALGRVFEHALVPFPAAGPRAVLQADVQWLKDHPRVRFYIEGYASTRGEDIIYNLVLSAKRAEGVRQALVGMGIPENRIVLTTGWGQLYPVCPEKNDACWSKNRRVILPSSQGSQ